MDSRVRHPSQELGHPHSHRALPPAAPGRPTLLDPGRHRAVLHHPLPRCDLTAHSLRRPALATRRGAPESPSQSRVYRAFFLFVRVLFCAVRGPGNLPILRSLTSGPRRHRVPGESAAISGIHLAHAGDEGGVEGWPPAAALHSQGQVHPHSHRGLRTGLSHPSRLPGGEGASLLRGQLAHPSSEPVRTPPAAAERTHPPFLYVCCRLPGTPQLGPWTKEVLLGHVASA